MMQSCFIGSLFNCILLFIQKWIERWSYIYNLFILIVQFVCLHFDCDQHFLFFFARVLDVLVCFLYFFFKLFCIFDSMAWTLFSIFSYIPRGFLAFWTWILQLQIWMKQIGCFCFSTSNLMNFGLMLYFWLLMMDMWVVKSFGHVYLHYNTWNWIHTN